MLENLDKALLYFCNHKLVNPAFDFLFVGLSDFGAYFWLMAIMALAVLWRGDTKARLVTILVLVGIAVTDPVSHYIMKELFHRLRPCHVLDNLRLIDGCGGQYGFPSNHAANSFAAATILTAFYRRFFLPATGIAAIISFSRVYLGKHYPSDVVAGTVWGFAVAIILIYFISRALKLVPESETQAALRNYTEEASRWSKRQHGSK